jgi:hypothetical protein
MKNNKLLVWIFLLILGVIVSLLLTYYIYKILIKTGNENEEEYKKILQVVNAELAKEFEGVHDRPTVVQNIISMPQFRICGREVIQLDGIITTQGISDRSKEMLIEIPAGSRMDC